MRDLGRQYVRRACSLLVAMALLLPGGSCAKRAASDQREWRARVERVIDGDTFVLADKEIVRLIGVDAPELARNDLPAQYYSGEAREFLKKLLEGREVSLRSDGRGRDKYGRALAYTYLDDTLFVNLEIVRRGFGFVYTRFPFDYMDDFRREEKSAMERGTGLWARDLDREGLKVIKASEAASHYGKRVMVVGRVVHTRNTGRVCFLNFSKDWKKDFTAVIFAGVFHKFPDAPQKFYMNKNVRLVGTVREYRGAPEIILNDRTEIEVTE